MENATADEHPDWNLVIARWDERDIDGNVSEFYSVSDDGGVTHEVHRANFTIGLGGVSRDPLLVTPDFPTDLLADTDSTMHVVQFITHSLPMYRQALRDLGATLHGYLPHHCYIVEMNAATRDAVTALPFVRWVGPYHPYYKLSPELREEHSAESVRASDQYEVSAFMRGEGPVQALADRINQIGGDARQLAVIGGHITARLTPDQVRVIASWDEISTIARGGEIAFFMNHARAVSGGAFVAQTAGFTGQGVRGEIVDGFGGSRPQLVHPGYDPPAVHIDTLGHDSAHATNTYGAIFMGAYPNDPTLQTRGVLEQASGAYTQAIDIIWSGIPGVIEPLCHTCQGVTTHPTNCSNRPGCYTNLGTFDFVFQNNSFGTNLGTTYHVDTASIDEAAFIFGMSHLYAQGNEGTQVSGAQAWAKNVVSVGGVIHLNDDNDENDRWNNYASIGPAADGRIKPDLVHFADAVTSTNVCTYNPPSGQQSPAAGCWTLLAFGTSIATPITSGYFGLFYQMWHNGVFNVCDGISCVRSGGAATVFDSRPSSFLAKAIMINTAKQYCFNDPSCPLSDLSRDRQGWGKVNVMRLYNLRESFPTIIDESVPLRFKQFAAYSVAVPSYTHALRATLVYRDPPAATGCDAGGGHCRVNDLSMKVWDSAASNDCYIGNDGLIDDVWSPLRSGFSNCNLPSSPFADSIDTVENVFIANPAAGTWNVRVQAIQINADGNVHFINDDPSECIPNPPPGCYDPADTVDDAVFALVVSIDRDCDQNGESDALDGHPVGACCVGGTCEVVPEPCCGVSGGVFHGDMTMCDDCDGDGSADICGFPGLGGACCLFGGTEECVVLDACSCLANSGVYIGDGTVCDPLTCEAQ